ncbi:MAG: cytochrome c [Saprospiraceae bacterium]
MNKAIIALIASLLIIACGGGPEKERPRSKKPVKKELANDKGIGEIKNVTLNAPLKSDMVDRGEAIFDMKCSACHRKTGTRVVGPGFAKVTERRKPEWIMNMVTNVEVMLDKDPAAQALLKECLVRMPNQNLSIDDARDVLEWMYANDGLEVSE